MRTFGASTIYVLGLLGLGIAAVNFSEWPALVAITLVVFAWSTWFGLVARRWMALLTPICIAALLVPLMLMIASGASGDGGAEAGAGMLFIGAAIAVLQLPAIGFGLAGELLLARAADRRRSEGRPMTAISITLAYGVGLLGLASVGLVTAGAEPVAWQTVAGFALVGVAGSVLAGLCARHWIVLAAPLGLAGLFLALAVMVTSGGP